MDTRLRLFVSAALPFSFLTACATQPTPASTGYSLQLEHPSSQVAAIQPMQPTQEEQTCNADAAGLCHFDLLFASDRVQLTTSSRNRVAPVLQYGMVSVAIPKGVHYGQVALDIALQDIHSSTPDELATVGRPQSMTQPQFLDELKNELESNRTGSVLIYIHGFADSFEAAAKRTAILSYEIGWKGSSVFYTWPSKGSFSVENYAADEFSVDWTTPHLIAFFEGILAQADAQHVYVIAHSMGTRAVTAALTDIALNDPGLIKHVDHLYLFAGDMDQEIFADQDYPLLHKSGLKITLYGSSNDLAIATSRKLHEYPLLGDGGPSVAVYPDMDTVDTSLVDYSNLLLGATGHGYLVESDLVVADLIDSLTGKADPYRAPSCLDSQLYDQQLPYWKLSKTPQSVTGAQINCSLAAVKRP